MKEKPDDGWKPKTEPIEVPASGRVFWIEEGDCYKIIDDPGVDFPGLDRHGTDNDS